MRPLNSVSVAVTCFLLQSASTIFTSVSDELQADEETKHVQESDNLTLVCNSTVLTDLSDYYWVKDDSGGNSSEPYATGQTLEFILISKEESGIYMCHALDNQTGENVTVMQVTVEVESPDDTKKSINLGIVIGCSVAGAFILVLVLAALAKRKSKTDRFKGHGFGYSMKSQYGSSLRSTHDASIKARYGSTLDESRSTLDGSVTPRGYPKIVYKNDHVITEST